jgi:hypothetical protein
MTRCTSSSLGGSVPGIAFADHPTGRNVESGEQRGRAVAGIIMAAPRRLSRTHRQQGLASVERLDLGFFVHTQDDRVRRWRHV